MANRNAIARSLTINVVGVGCVAAAGLLSTLLMARWMPAAEFGKFSMLLLAFNAIAVLDGVRPIMVYLGAQSAALGPRAHTGEVVAAAMGLAVTVATFVSTRIVWPDQLGMVEAGVLAVGLGLYFPMSCYWGLLDSQHETAFTGGLRSAAWTCAYGAFLTGALLKAGPIWYLAAFCAMNGALLVAYGVRLYRRYELAGGRSEHGLAATIGHAVWNTIVFNVGALVLASVDRIVLGWTAGPVPLGLYSGVYELATKPAALLRVTSTVLYPAAAHLQTDTAALARHWLRGIRIAFSLVFCVVSAVVFFRAPLAALLLGERFASAADAFGLLAFGFALVVLGYSCGITLYALGDFESQRKAYSIAAVAMIVLAWPMVATWGMTGAGALYLAVRTVDVGLLFMTAKKLRHDFAVRRAALVVALCTATAVCSWIGWAVPAVLCLAAFLLAIGLRAECRALLPATWLGSLPRAVTPGAQPPKADEPARRPQPYAEESAE